MKAKSESKRIWIDLDNSPHVPFFRPIIQRLVEEGVVVILTARDAYQVRELIKMYDLECRVIGRHYGKNKVLKLLGLLVRTGQLLPFCARCRPCLAVSHGSRAQTLVAKVLGIPSVVIADYEHVVHLTRPDWIIVPEVMPTHVARNLAQYVWKYPGIKEDVYIPAFHPDPSIYAQLDLNEDEVIVTVRPPATEAHYHSPDSERLFAAVMSRLVRTEGVRTVLLPRNDQQKARLARQWAGSLRSKKVVIPERAVDGLNLIWHSDSVISGGGTMNREAAALGVPVYSIFRGKIGAVDRYLAQTGRLVLVETIEDLERTPFLTKRKRSSQMRLVERHALEVIANGIMSACNNAGTSAQLVASPRSS